MGTSQSAPEVLQQESSSTTAKAKKVRKGIHLAEYKCRRKKANYNICYNAAYKRFIDAQAAQAGHECATEFEDYRTCVLRSMKKQLVDQGRVDIHPESMLGELNDDE